MIPLDLSTFYLGFRETRQLEKHFTIVEYK